MSEQELIDSSRLLQYIIHIYELANKRYLTFPATVQWADMEAAMFWYQQATQALTSSQPDKRDDALQAVTFREIHAWMDNHVKGTSVGQRK